MLNLQKFCLTKFSCYTVVIKHRLRKHGCQIARTFVLPNKILCCVSDRCDGMTFRIVFWPFHKSFVSRKFGSIRDCMLEQWYRKYWEARPLHMHVSLDVLKSTAFCATLCWLLSTCMQLILKAADNVYHAYQSVYHKAGLWSNLQARNACCTMYIE